MSHCTNDKLHSILRKYDALQQKFFTLNGYEIDSKVNEICNKCKIDNDMLNRKFNSLSGGEKVRLKLFELIQKNINFLIMDEPTNHIDITTKEVLETALKEYPGTLLFISHDRYFINALAKKIFYIEDKKIKEYLGNYDAYLACKERQIFQDENRKLRK